MNFSVALPLLIGIPLLASPIIYMAGRLNLRRSSSPNAAWPARWLAILTLAACGVPLYFLAQYFFGSGPSLLYINNIPILVDGISLLLAVTVLILGIMVALFSTNYLAGDAGEEKFYALLVVMIAAIIGLGSANDLFNLWVWFEVMAISSYMLVAFYRQKAQALEAGVKYLVQSAAGSVLVLLGVALVFSQTGSLELTQIRFLVQGQPPSAMLLAAGALFIIGFGVKAALVPLHTWLPDAHSQAPSGISAMLSGIVIEAGLIAMLRAVGSVSASSPSWGFLLLVFGAFNMILGNLMALRQTQIKRLLAYSSISQVGYMLVGFGVGIAFLQINGAAGGFFHLFTHALMKGLAFLAAGALLYALRIANGNHDSLNVEDLDGTSRRYPVTAFTFSVALLALGGLPPLAGFMSKWQIFVAGFETRNTVAIILVIFAALNSVLSLAYYAPLVNRMYRHTPSELVKAGKPISWQMAVPLWLLTLAVVLVGFWPTILNWLTFPAAASLLSAFGG